MTYKKTVVVQQFPIGQENSRTNTIGGMTPALTTLREFCFYTRTRHTSGLRNSTGFEEQKKAAPKGGVSAF
jgi:hypothetical protein